MFPLLNFLLIAQPDSWNLSLQTGNIWIFSFLLPEIISETSLSQSWNLVEDFRKYIPASVQAKTSVFFKLIKNFIPLLLGINTASKRILIGSY